MRLIPLGISFGVLVLLTQLGIVGSASVVADSPKPLVVDDTSESKKPNIVVVFADDISARELPIYGSTVWTPPAGGDSSEPKFRAKTPVLDRLAKEGCWFKNAWASVVCSPSRAMLMTGRYAHLHKWWTNNDFGMLTTKSGAKRVWPLYESSPWTIGHAARQAGYSTYWAGKTQMKNSNLQKFGFDEGCFTAGPFVKAAKNPNTDFKLIQKGKAKNKADRQLERNMLEEVLPRFDKHATAHDAPVKTTNK